MKDRPFLQEVHPHLFPNISNPFVGEKYVFFYVIRIKDNIVTGGEVDIQKLTRFHVIAVGAFSNG